MKRLSKYLLVVTLMFLLVGCGNKTMTTKEINFDAKYVRTDGNIIELDEPAVTKIQSVDELKSYYNDNKDKYNFTDNSSLSSSFATEIDKYDEAFFNNSFLMVILLEEESGDIYHKVKSVNDKGIIAVDRGTSDKGNNDAATWHILIELSNDYKDIDYKVKLNKIK